MCLKLSLSPSKSFLQAVLSLTVFSNCISGSSTFTPVFSLTVSNFEVVSCYWIGNLMRILKICLKLSFSHSKWVLQAILSLSVH